MDTERRIPIVIPSFACLVKPGTVPSLESQSWKAGGFAEMCKVTTDTHPAGRHCTKDHPSLVG